MPEFQTHIFPWFICLIEFIKVLFGNLFVKTQNICFNFSCDNRVENIPVLNCWKKLSVMNFPVILFFPAGYRFDSFYQVFHWQIFLKRKHLQQHMCKICGQMLLEGKNIPGTSRDWLTETKPNNRLVHFYRYIHVEFSYQLFTCSSYVMYTYHSYVLIQIGTEQLRSKRIFTYFC